MIQTNEFVFSIGIEVVPKHQKMVLFMNFIDINPSLLQNHWLDFFQQAFHRGFLVSEPYSIDQVLLFFRSASKSSQFPETSKIKFYW